MLIRSAIGEFRNKVILSAAGLWIPRLDLLVPRHKNVLAVLGRPDGTHLIPASNIITDAGDIHYAQRGAAETPTNAFGILELGSAGTPGKTVNRASFTAIASTQKAHDATYPKTNDGDTDNTGAGADVVTWLTSYTKADFNANGITHGWITNASPGASEAILAGYAFAASFNKTANDTLKVFTNHTQNGV